MHPDAHYDVHRLEQAVRQRASAHRHDVPRRRSSRARQTLAALRHALDSSADRMRGRSRRPAPPPGIWQPPAPAGRRPALRRRH